jgi:hypothetical protein
MARKDKSGNSSWADEMNASSSKSQDSDTWFSSAYAWLWIWVTVWKTCPESKDESNRHCRRRNSNSGLQEPLLSFTPTTEEVQIVAHNLATSIFSDWSQLQVVIEHYEGTLRKRWENKTEGSKASILLNAWPGMSFLRRPDFHAFVNENCGQKCKGWLNSRTLICGRKSTSKIWRMAGIYCFTLILGDVIHHTPLSMRTAQHAFWGVAATQFHRARS